MIFGHPPDTATINFEGLGKSRLACQALVNEGGGFRSSLAREIGSKGYHDLSFVEGPYPVDWREAAVSRPRIRSL
jgi:hypothetical protein